MAAASFSTGFNALAGQPKPPKAGTPTKPKPLGATLTTGPQATFRPNPTVKPQVAPTGSAKPVTSGTTTAAPVSPLDSTYYDNLAGNQLRVNNQLNSLNSQSQNSATSLQSALAQLAYQQPRDQLNLEQGANNRGALYSSVEGQQQGNLLNSYQTKQSSAVQSNAQKQASIAANISAILQGSKLYGTGQYDAAVARATKAAAANPATGQAAVPPPIPQATLAARTAAGKAQGAQKAALAKAIAGQKKGTAMFTQTGARTR